MTDIGQKIRDLRIEKGLSLQQIADGVCCSKAHIWELETGKSNNPSLGLLKRLAGHFGVTVAGLVGEAVEPGDEQIMKMNRDLKYLSEADRALIEDLIASMKKRKAGLLREAPSAQRIAP
jgi:transcriptional regulator with XRE-family HTH domain